MRHEAAGVTTDVFPKQLALRGKGGPDTAFGLSYHFEPGSPRDGVTMTVPLVALNQIDAVRAEWLVPGMLKEKAHLLLKSLPQKLRRHCVPLPDYAAAFAARQGHRSSEPLLDVLIDDVREHAGVVCQRADFKLETLPAHLTMNFKVVDDTGRQLGDGPQPRTAACRTGRGGAGELSHGRTRRCCRRFEPRDRHPRLGLR